MHRGAPHAIELLAVAAVVERAIGGKEARHGGKIVRDGTGRG
jgi:hypothetical protein